MDRVQFHGFGEGAGAGIVIQHDADVRVCVCVCVCVCADSAAKHANSLVHASESVPCRLIATRRFVILSKAIDTSPNATIPIVCSTMYRSCPGLIHTGPSARRHRRREGVRNRLALPSKRVRHVWSLCRQGVRAMEPSSCRRGRLPAASWANGEEAALRCQG